MNVKVLKAQQRGLKKTEDYSKKRHDNQKSYLRNWNRCMAVKTTPMPHRIRKGA